MEIKFLNVSTKDKNKTIKNLNLELKSGRIIGIYQDKNHIISNLLTNSLSYQGNILIDNESLLESSSIISYINNLDNYVFFPKTVSDTFYLLKHKLTDLSNEEYLKKIISSLSLIGLDKSFLKKDILKLSKSEKRLLQITSSLILNPDVLIIDEPFLNLDKHSIFHLKKILFEMKKKYQKVIVIESLDINVLYELCDNLIILKDNHLLISDKVKNIFNNLSFLENNQIALPNSVLFKKIASNYQIKLSDNKEVNDLIKEVYRHARKIKKEV